MSETSGIKATDNLTGQEFFFYTELQEDVEHSMTLMGYGCRDYNLSEFKNRKQPVDCFEYRKRDKEK